MPSFARPKPKYDPQDEIEFRAGVEEQLRGKLDRGQSIELADAQLFIYMRSPNGSRWKLSVSNAGALVVTAA